MTHDEAMAKALAELPTRDLRGQRDWLAGHVADLRAELAEAQRGFVHKDELAAAWRRKCKDARNDLALACRDGGHLHQELELARAVVEAARELMQRDIMGGKRRPSEICDDITRAIVAYDACVEDNRREMEGEPSSSPTPLLKQ